MYFYLVFTSFIFSGWLNLFSTSNISSKIEKIIKKLPGSTSIAIMVYDPISMDTIYQRNINKIMVPASNTKLFTTATALSIMGPDYGLKTSS